MASQGMHWTLILPVNAWKLCSVYSQFEKKKTLFGEELTLVELDIWNKHRRQNFELALLAAAHEGHHHSPLAALCRTTCCPQFHWLSQAFIGQKHLPCCCWLGLWERFEILFVVLHWPLLCIPLPCGSFSISWSEYYLLCYGRFGEDQHEWRWRLLREVCTSFAGSSSACRNTGLQSLCLRRALLWRSLPVSVCSGSACRSFILFGVCKCSLIIWTLRWL